MLHLFRQADFVQHLRREDILHGIRRRMRLLKEKHCAFRLHSVPTAAKRWIKRHRFFGQWKH